MIPVLLLDELCAFLADVVKNYSFDTNKNTKRAPQTVPGWLPLKGSTDEPDFPYIVPRLVDGIDQQDGSMATVRILFGVYADSSDGWRDLLNLMEHTRQALLKRRYLAKKFRLEFPIKWESLDEQPYPEWVGSMTTVWTIAQPIEEDVYDEAYFD